jgi:carbon-monoxide dehydrogenase medium subunit
MKPASFTYHRAHDVSEAIDLLGQLGDEAKLIAGGQSLVPMMNLRLSRPSALVDVSRLDELDYVRREGDRLRIGAMVRHRALEVPVDPGPVEGFEVLSAAARLIGHHPIRTMGTFGGSIAHADSASEWCLLAVLLDAEVVVRGPGGERTIPAADFFRGFLTTALAPDEVVLEVVVAGPVPGTAVREYARRQGDFAIVVAGAAVEVTSGRIDRARVAAGGIESVPVRLPEVEALLRGAAPSAELFAEAGRLAQRSVAASTDAHASAEYRRRLTGVLVRGALADAAELVR